MTETQDSRLTWSSRSHDQIKSNVKYFYSFQCARFKPLIIILRGNNVKPIKNKKNQYVLVVLKYYDAKHTSKSEPPKNSQIEVLLTSALCGWTVSKFKTGDIKHLWTQIKTKHTSHIFIPSLKLEMHSVSFTPQPAAVSEVRL